MPKKRKTTSMGRRPQVAYSTREVASPRRRLATAPLRALPPLVFTKKQKLRQAAARVTAAMPSRSSARRSARAALFSNVSRPQDIRKNCATKKNKRRQIILSTGHGGRNNVKNYKPRRTC